MAQSDSPARSRVRSAATHHEPPAADGLSTIPQIKFIIVILSRIDVTDTLVSQKTLKLLPPSKPQTASCQPSFRANYRIP